MTLAAALALQDAIHRHGLYCVVPRGHGPDGYYCRIVTRHGPLHLRSAADWEGYWQERERRRILAEHPAKSGIERLIDRAVGLEEEPEQP